MATSPRILLMDEPTAALDPKTSELLLSRASEIIRHAELTVIMVTHNVKEANKYGNRIIQLQEGRIVRDLDGGQKLKTSLSDIYSWF